jgi:hypothetical protein
MDGGLIESALISAAVGGGTAAVSGKDPLQGALMGGLMGGIGGSLMGGAMPGAAAATQPGITSLAPEAANMLNPAAATNFSLGAPAGIEGLKGGFELPASLTNLGGVSSAFNPTAASNFSLSAQAAPQGLNLGAQAAAPQGLSLPPEAASAFGTTPPAGMETAGLNSLKGNLNLPTSLTNPSPTVGEDSGFIHDLAKEWRSLPASKKLLYGGLGAVGLTALSAPKESGYTPEKYTGPLSKGWFTNETYRSGSNRGYASGGIADLGSYSDGGRMLKGPGDGMSDNIPATIAGKQPARLANEEFVVPADVVSHLGNGSSDAGAKQLYAMMNRVRKARTGNPKQGREINAGKYLPA